MKKMTQEEFDKKIAKVPFRQPKIIMDMSDCINIFDHLGDYKRNLGWTWKRLFLIGVADAIIKQGDNPEIAIEIANYLQGRR